MSLSSIESDINEIEDDASLLEEKNYDKRTDAIDLLEFQIMEHLNALFQNGPANEELHRLKSRAEKMKTELKAVDDKLFERLQSSIRAGEYKRQAFRDLVAAYFDLSKSEQLGEGYDNLDIFINRLLSHGDIPEQSKDLQPEMVYYKNTPARLIFELTDKVDFAPDDVFVDIGSGLGQVGILVNLLTGCKTIGIEFEPAFFNYANDNAEWLNLPEVSFINIDARKADYSTGNIFFMYTPFWGKMLSEVLERLRQESLRRKITLVTYGPCNTEVGKQSWLETGVNWISLV